MSCTDHQGADTQHRSCPLMGEWKRERKTERNINVRETHQLFVYCMSPDQGLGWGGACNQVDSELALMTDSNYISELTTRELATLKAPPDLLSSRTHFDKLPKTT
ncbi:hypothetical protein D623_10019212 [Myotis brandtii]|uniref:Uncharacterized protein n=1 Tax=Myotis brandtii TaxID=109478 RepID=S7N4Q2_MYOBR|nr:hypothetical protein D623_10019212 [Myotis brandtii]